MVELYIAFKHIKERKFQTFFSVLGVTISLTVLIVSLAVSNGLENKMIGSILSLSSHITVTGENGYLEDYAEYKNEIKSIEGVKGVAEKYEVRGIIKSSSFSEGVMINSFNSEDFSSVYNIEMVDGNNSLDELDTILIGEVLAAESGIRVGNTVTLVTAENQELDLVVRGIFKTGYYEYDRNLTIIPLQTLQILEGNGEIISELSVMLDHPNDSQKINNEISNKNFPLVTYTWGDKNSNLLSAIKFEKFVLVSILILLVIIASFAVAVILNMIVREKTKDIGILRATGYSKKQIKNIFTLEGLLLGLFGIICSAILAPIILKILSILFDTFVANTYYLDSLPVKITIKEILIIYFVAIIIIYLSTLIPAYKASKLNPVEAIKYE